MRNTDSEIEKHLVLELRGITIALQRLTEFYERPRRVLPALVVENATATPKLRPNRGCDKSGFVPRSRNR
jgi:hypothetical protein